MDKQIRGRGYVGPERRTTKPPVALIFLSLMAVAAIAYATLCPIGLRPHLATADQERFGAYLVLGFLLSFTLPRRWAAVSVLVVLLACGLEAGQLLVPGRDAHVHDALVKSLGGVAGVSLGCSVYRLKRLVARALEAAKPSTLCSDSLGASPGAGASAATESTTADLR
jgi:hypothetical protein